jgi:dipeptidyl aminopeptidase/acylaminoacyl peptidase
LKLFLVALAAVLSAATPALAMLPPVSAFVGYDSIRSVQISPDGQRLAIVGREGEQSSIKFATVDQPKVTIANLGDVAISRVRWLGNDRVTVETTFTTKIFGQYRTLGRVAVVDAGDGHAATMLLDDKTSNNLVRHELVGEVPGASAYIYMVGGVTEGRLAYRSLLKVDVLTGRGDPIEVGSATTYSFIVDKTGAVHGRMLSLKDGDFAVEVRATHDAPWEQVWRSHGADDRRGYHGYSLPDDAILITTRGPDGDQLLLKRLTDGSTTPIGEPHKTDPVTYVWDEKGHTLAGRAFGSERPQMEWLQPDLAAVQSSLEKVFKSADVFLEDWSLDRNRFVVVVSSPDIPTTRYLYDKSRKELSPLGDTHPGLKGVTLGVTHWITYKARDGLELSAYVTLPPGAGKAGQRPPLIVLPHDDLRSRDRGGFDGMVQFLATRGYAVLRPQYRGSSGFGDAFEKAADWEWGGKVQTDLLDGIAALASEGLIDSKRVCIVGDSFAGYLALAGAALHPDAYACAVSTSGASDLTGIRAGWGGAPFWPIREVLEKTDIRDPRYAIMSPRVHAGAVQGPVLLMWKEQDAIMPPEQSEAMAWALKAAHKQVETVVLADTDHYERTGKGATQQFEALETFLAKNLPVAQP